MVGDDAFGRGRGLIVGRAIFLVITALAFGVPAWMLSSDPPYVDELTAHQIATWRIFFLIIVALCVAALSLGTVSLFRGAAFSAPSISLGVLMAAVGGGGCILAATAFSALHGDYSTVPLVTLFIGGTFGAAGLLVTGLSVTVALMVKRS